MPDEVETGTDTTEEKVEEAAKAEEEQQPAEPPAAKKPKAEKAAATEAEAPAPKGKKTAIYDIMSSIKNMTVLELSELVKALENEFGVSAAVAAPAAATAAPAASEAAPADAEEKTEFNVILKDIGANKINVIKAVRELTSLGLKESKDLVESAPKAVREGVTKEEAATIKQTLEAAGATVEVT